MKKGLCAQSLGKKEALSSEAQTTLPINSKVAIGQLPFRLIVITSRFKAIAHVKMNAYEKKYKWPLACDDNKQQLPISPLNQG